MSRWFRTLPILTLLPLATLAAQQPYVNELPGMGRPIDVAAASARRQRLMQRLGDAVVVIPAAHELSVEADGDHPQANDFRQSNTFFYFSMLEAQDAWIVMNASAGSGDAILFLPPRNPARERWTGVRLGPDTLAVRLTGFATVLPTPKLDSVLAALLARNAPIYVPIDLTTRDEPLIRRLRADSGAGRDVRNLRPIVDSMRVIKDAVEVAALRTAARISAEAHADLMRAARPGMFEYEMEAVLEAGFRRRGGDRLGYPSIVGSGINGTTLHYDVNRRQSVDGDLVVVDAAAEYAQYTADVTRTFPINGRFTPRQRAIYELVLGTQQAAMDSVHPGQTVQRLNQIAREYMRSHSGDLCPPSPGEGPDRTGCDRYFIHGLSHSIGMDVHDVGPLNVLAPGVVFTIEPGIYIPAEALGVRIEDDILVTESGGENLSAAAPRAAADIERLMREGRSAAAATRSER
jgi:Xaa-Pro aminopeptidase